MRTAQMLFGNHEPNVGIKHIAETPTGLVDGVNKTFTLTNTPIANSELLFMSGALRYPVLSYNISGNIITFVEAPYSGTVLWIKYNI